MSLATVDHGQPQPYRDPNECPACTKARELCADHLAVMRDQAADAVILLAVMDAEHRMALALMDQLKEQEAGPCSD